MRKICNFGDGGESLWQIAEDGDFTKLFCIKDADGGAVTFGENTSGRLVPCLKDSDDVRLLLLKDVPEDVDWLNLTGLSYTPVGFYIYENCPEEVLECFFGSDIDEPLEEDLPLEVDRSVYPLSDLCEDARDKVKPDSTFIEKVMELVHLRGTQTHRLGMIDKEIQQLEKEFHDKMSNLKHEQNKVLEVIDTYHKTIEILLKGADNG